MNKIVREIDREALLSELAERFYNKNFGSLSKTDLELIMFRLYFHAAEKCATDENGRICESAISDYKIGADLGLSPARVRNLRLKMELQSKEVFNWKEELGIVLQNPSNLSTAGDYFEITIRSRMLFFAVEDWLEDRGSTADITLNPKQLRVKKNDFYALLTDLTLINDNQNRQALENLQNKLKTDEKAGNFLEFAMKALDMGESVANIIASISSAFIPGAAIVGVIGNILNLYMRAKEQKRG